jgi:anaerobic magnesium-protoporphyrin IX monomethyl ester cyclase
MAYESVGAVLIGFQDQTNLGLGYLASTLRGNGFNARIVDFRQGPGSILEAARAANTLLVGFSLIFQYYLPEFGRLVSCLRENGVDSHFCAGGHYPTLRYDEVLQAIPGLDSIALCEGELTLAELMQCLAHGRDWRHVAGLAYRDGDRCVLTPPRALIADLDGLPCPVRPIQDPATLGMKAAAMLASRGCARDCSFCSIRQFYGAARGKKVRVRRPEKVAEEMRVLHEERGISVFPFQDDDFPVWGSFGRRWLDRFVVALESEGLVGSVIWKISCRADEVEPELFGRLRDAGLYMVYLGLESGNAAGLAAFNKRLTVDDNLRAAAIVHGSRLSLGYGFMMFDPSSTFETVRANVSFLRQITGDGLAAAHFCRMVPYAGTPIEASLAQEGRLRGDSTSPDYGFLHSRMEGFFSAVSDATTDWINGRASLKNQLNWAWQEYWVLQRLFAPMSGLDAYERFLRSITRRSNKYLLDLVEEASFSYEAGDDQATSAAEVRAVSDRFSEQLLAKRNAFIYRNQTAMLASVQAAVPESVGDE